jgi:TolB protein
MSSYQCTGAMLLFGAAFFANPLVNAQQAAQPLGIFDSHQDVGTVLHPGTAEYDAKNDQYIVNGNGENMWFGRDDFHFAWKKISGDVALDAEISFVGSVGNPHRKAVVMMRQSLDDNSPLVDIAFHAAGLTTLQYRTAPGADTHEVQANELLPRRVRIEKRGDIFYAFVSGKDGKMHPAGTSTKLALTGDFYVGIGVCSHDKDVSEKVVFSHVKLERLAPAAGKLTLISSLETISIASTDRHVEYSAAAHFEAPNWSRDGSNLIFNQDGGLRLLHLIPDADKVKGNEAVAISTGAQNHCNNDHGLSPDGQWLAISDSSAKSGKSQVYILPSTGGTPRLITPNAPSYWHGWSPDGKTLAFVGERDGNFDIYTIPANGGEETRLTTAAGLDDGPEYSPDGAWIYFNSERTGQMQIWRMKPDGSQQEQVIASDSNDWFPHISPDGQWMVFLAYDKSVSGHPAEKDVELRLMSMTDKKVHVLTRLFGGQGTINVPSWSPDSKRLAFVSYELLPEESLNLK